MDEMQVVEFVATYLKKKGFSEVENALQAEIQRTKNSSSSNSNNNNNNTVGILNDPELSKFFCSLSESEDSPTRYQDEYSKLRSWTYSSLDLYKEMEFAHSLRHNKVNIKICQYLHKTQSTTMLGIINERINFQVSPGQPNTISDDAEVVTLIGSNQDAANQINQKEVHWGKRTAEGGKQGATVKKLKKEKATSATAKAEEKHQSGREKGMSVQQQKKSPRPLKKTWKEHLRILLS
ncbi:hypothetical protein Ddye_028108 [Dipteronia dyeriana]|uniref:LisH domain-containing protein n=1 Tax=Dipteronia dyeriana TaxID=168575 RepID=A0AAD9TR90_9ROSI|nr:hypothetical protein Ddye_028108 [Dipteronia dyeriana]